MLGSGKANYKSKVTDDAIAGGCAGATARMITAPFDVLKIRFQLQSQLDPKYKTILQSFRKVVADEGIFALWKGNLSASYLWVSYMTVQFSMYGVLKRYGEQLPNPFFSDTHSGTNHLPESSVASINNAAEMRKAQAWHALVLFLAGAGAGTTSVALTYPFDIMRTQFALQGKEVVYKSMGSFISHTYHTKGVRGFYAGLTPAVVGITPQMGLNFALYETFKSLTATIGSAVDLTDSSKTKKDSMAFATLKKGFCGGAAGGISKLIVYPLDTVKKRLQAQVLHNTMSCTAGGATYNGFFHCFKTIHATEGLQGFYRGIVATTAKSVASTAITFAAYEAAKDFLASRRD